MLFVNFNLSQMVKCGLEVEARGFNSGPKVSEVLVVASMEVLRKFRGFSSCMEVV